jgi:hypothetical protein
MDNDVTCLVEQIPDEDSVYFRAHSTHFRGDDLQPGVFQEKGSDGCMSVDWERYSSCYESRNRSKIPNQNAILEMRVGDIRQINPLSVEHRPFPENRAHSGVVGLPRNGEDLTEVRMLLLKIAPVVLGLELL